MDLQEACASSAAVELVDVLGDDRDLATLPAESLLALCDGLVGGVGLLGEHDLTAVVVKLPNAGRIPGEGLWSGETLDDQTKKRFSLETNSGETPVGSWLNAAAATSGSDTVMMTMMMTIPALAIFSSSLQRL